MIIAAANRTLNIKEYYFSRKLKAIRAMVEAGRPVINLGIGNPDMMPSEETIETLVENASQREVHGYQGYVGLPELREAFAQWYETTYGIKLNPENEILPLMGSKEGIVHISQAFVNPEDIVLVPNPGYPTYTSATYLSGGIPVSYTLLEEKKWSPDLSALERQMRSARIVWINYPNMPTGSSGDRNILKDIIQLAKETNTLIINDNPYSLVLNDEKPFSIFQLDGAKEVTLELNSLSKSHNMAGWRIGVLTGDSEYIQTVLKVKSNMDSGMFKPLQLAAITALKTSEEWHNRRNSEYLERKKIAQLILDELNCKYTDNQIGMFQWAKIDSSYNSSESLSDDVLENTDVFITPGFIFGDKGNEYVRISLCNNQETLKTALKRIQAWKKKK